MLEPVYPNIYRNIIPLPQNPLKSLNSYIIISQDRNLIIDTGFNQPECEQALHSGIAELGIDIAKTDVVLTHRHSDHTGLAGDLEQSGARIFAGNKEITAIQETSDQGSWTWMNELIAAFGLNKYGITVSDHPGYRYRTKTISRCAALSEGDKLQCGDYSFSVVDIPGHTPGHIGLYEERCRLFFCGDHVLSSITPNITFWNFEQDSLGQYLNSLRKVHDIDIDWLFTAHREIIRDHKTRIDQLICHHDRRIDEIIHILEAGKNSACEVAAQMKWEIRAKAWAEFPKAQKWFASGEAAAHLEYLYNKRRINRITSVGTNYYSL